MKNRTHRAIAFVFVVIFTLLNVHADLISCDQLDHYSEQKHHTIKLDSLESKDNYSLLETAYLKQACKNATTKQKIIGFKAGLTSRLAQEKFNSRGPIFGVLIKENQLLSRSAYIDNNIHLLEAELAYKVKNDINHLHEINADISQLVYKVAPVVEVAKIISNDTNEINLNEIVENNAGAYRLRLGSFVPLENISINHIKSNVIFKGRLIETGISNNPLSDQKFAIKWLMKKALLEGYSIKKNAILLTGAITIPLELNQGNYVVDFGVLGEINLSVDRQSD